MNHDLIFTATHDSRLPRKVFSQSLEKSYRFHFCSLPSQNTDKELSFQIPASVLLEREISQSAISLDLKAHGQLHYQGSSRPSWLCLLKKSSALCDRRQICSWSLGQVETEYKNICIRASLNSIEPMAQVWDVVQTLISRLSVARIADRG